jgi:hypothetical protein
MTKLRGSAKAQWFDPSAGSCRSIAGSPFANSGSHSFATPVNDSDGDADWLLVLEANP